MRPGRELDSALSIKPRTPAEARQKRVAETVAQHLVARTHFSKRDHTDGQLRGRHRCDQESA